jgi:hypothetical protein
MKGQIMKGHTLAGLLAIASILGCSDYTLEKVQVYEPNISVSPTEHDFGALHSGYETGEIDIAVTNTGNTELLIDDVYIMGPSDITFSPSLPSSMSPGEEVTLTVTYVPETFQIDSARLYIFSDDPDTPIVEIPLDGQGDAPVIEITPDYHDFVTVLLGCYEKLEVKIGNVGNANLEINDVEYFATLPVDFLLADYEESLGPLPWTIAPADVVSLHVAYEPLDLLDDEAYIEITSNDPVAPIEIADQIGMGDYEDIVTDNFDQDGNARSDILFVIDNSGSMSSNQTNFKNNFDSFMTVFEAAGVDYQIAFITTDDASIVNGKIVTPADADPVGEVNTIIDDIGTHGYAIEKGLWYSYAATDIGGDAAPGSSTGFFRTDAKLVIIYVSDEPDASTSLSYGGGSTTMAPSDYSAHLLALKSSPELVVAHAVSGDYPSGCTSNGGAQFGDGYYDVVNDLGGTFMSICAADFGAQLDTLARESMAIQIFYLNNNPIESTISVAVDSTIVTTWSYDSTINAIVFDTPPEEGSSIEVTYATWAECDSEKDTGDTGS